MPAPRIGLDLGGTKIEGIVLDGEGRELARRRVATPRGEYDLTIRTIAEMVAALERAAGSPQSPPATVGIGIPGTISPATGLVKNANSTWLNGRPLREDLETSLGRPVRLANDANCFALSESLDGAAAGQRVVFGAILGTGCGGGIVVDGAPIVGPHAIAGEWGHNPLPWPGAGESPGPACWCGRSGCLETFLSGPGLSADDARAAAAGESPRTAEAIAAAARSGEPRALASVDRYEDRLARSLATIINILDPDAIVLGGGLSAMARLYENVPRRWGPFVFSDRVETPLLAPGHGDASGVRGAARLWR